MFDFTPVGTLVGNVGPLPSTTPGAGTATTRWAAVDAPVAFAISPDGDVTVAAFILDAVVKSTHAYSTL